MLLRYTTSWLPEPTVSPHRWNIKAKLRMRMPPSRPEEEAQTGTNRCAAPLASTLGQSGCRPQSVNCTPSPATARPSALVPGPPTERAASVNTTAGRLMACSLLAPTVIRSVTVSVAWSEEPVSLPPEARGGGWRQWTAASNSLGENGSTSTLAQNRLCGGRTRISASLASNPGV
ncbi:hypothetical protein VTK26DRAFT_2920 [Humicola hyalothermophila]